MSDTANPANQQLRPSDDSGASVPSTPDNSVPSRDVLRNQLAEASALVDDIVLKKYLTNLTGLELIPLDADLKKIGDIRLFKINEMVYQNDEYSTYKFASVFNSVQNLNCGIFIIADSDGQKTDFYMGVRSLDKKRTTKSLKDTLKNALSGQFPGVKTDDLLDPAAEKFLANISSKNIATVSCVAKNKDEEFKDNERFIQGLEKLALAMHGQRYTAVVLAKSTPHENLEAARRAYEFIYTQLSPFANMQLSYGTNTSLNISDAFSSGTTTGTSHSITVSTQTGESYSEGTGTNVSETKPNTAEDLAKRFGLLLLGGASIVTAPLTGGASLAAAGAIIAGQVVLNSITPSSETKGKSENKTWSENISITHGETDSANESTSENRTTTRGTTTGTSDNMQLSMQNKTLVNTLERIDLQLKRIDECESLGMWECAAYFLSDSQETAEMAAGTYKALMRGEKSGVEISAINFWGHKNVKLPILREYITNFIHPVFAYRSKSAVVPVTASSLISGNELAIQMGLPRKSLCGFPVIEHADFGKEVVKYNKSTGEADFILGKVFSMGSESATEVRLDRDSLAMHTFITGSTGSGKSNTVYEILNQLRILYNIPFLVIEPAKGEYKNIFGRLPNVSVYGTNPNKFNLVRINPFSFPPDIHVLEHMDRLVELFNVCWPMYAAMPAILKEAMERAYAATGWDVTASKNPKGEVFPNFSDLLEHIEIVMNESQYSSENKGNYSGALCTRVRSLTNGLNGLIFRNEELSAAELFDKNVIVDLSRVGSAETKSLLMGLLVMKLNEYRMASGKFNSPLAHVTVLEEAHNLLKRTSTEQSSEGANLLGKSVEMLANSIAEMRTYGEGFIIADQSPGLLDLSVIRNTNTKIILRLPEQSDRELVGLAACLNAEQIKELAKLERGVAAFYQNDWVEPVLVKVNKCELEEKTYISTADPKTADISTIKRQILFLLIQSGVSERLTLELEKIEQALDAFGLSTRTREFLEEQVAEFKETGNLSLWHDTELSKLSPHVAELLGVRKQVEKCVLASADIEELTRHLADIVKQSIPDASERIVLTISKCLMKDMSTGLNEVQIRKRIYGQWVESVKEGAIKP
jgi:DNA helicase HerA-like ATPase